MAQFYTVSNSMRAKDKDGNPKVWESQYGTFEVWNLYFENDDTKYQVNKKPGFSGYQKGSSVYGTATLGQYGGRFKQEQTPDGMEAPASPAPKQQAQSSGSCDCGEKIDYLVELVEQFLSDTTGKAPQESTSPTDSEVDGPVDLSEIPF